MQWDICCLHVNELPLTHYFSYLDEATTGPKSFSGPLGEMIMKKEEVNEMPIVKFQPIKTFPLPNINRAVLSKDQQYLFDIVNAVMDGNATDKLAKRKLGKVHNARFLNLASIILRIYISTDKPSKPLKSLAEFDVKVSKFCKTLLFFK